MTWWDEFVKVLASPNWAAGFVQAILGATIAFLGALVIVRRQLRHDRELVAEQMKALGADRAAEKRSEAARALGLSLVEASEATSTIRPLELLDLITDQENKAPGAKVIYDAEEDSHLVLDIDSTVLDLWRELLRTWSIIQEESRRVMLGNSDIEKHALSAAADALLTPIQSALNMLGLGLIRWDGNGAPPSAEILNGWSPIPITDRAAHAEWRERVRREFERERQAAIDRRLARD